MADMKAFERECEAFFRPLFPGADKILVFGEGKCDHPAIMLIGICLIVLSFNLLGDGLRDAFDPKLRK